MNTAAPVLVVFGTRPEAIKMAPVVAALRQRLGARVQICVTAQHRQMLDQVLDLFDLQPDTDLNLMRPGQSLSSLVARAIDELSREFEKRLPALVLVHGDTSTTLAATLAAFHARVPVAHVEAGLRTGDMQAPWPEEMNRRVVGVMGSLHFAPTAVAREHLLAEGVHADSIELTGNTVIDALLQVSNRLQSDAGLSAKAAAFLPTLDPARRTILVTAHRRESFGPGFEQICSALARLAERDDVQIVYPVHLNPNVQEPVRRWLSDRDNVHLIAPLDYLPFVEMMRRCDFILTDSGGVQEEAPSLGKPVLVLRETTERPEAVAAGTARLVGTSADRIVSEACRLLDDPQAYQAMATANNPYGDGKAAQRIADACVAYLRTE